MSAAHAAEMPQFDREMSAFMAKWQVPGASLAVASRGKVGFAKGYGLVDNG